MPRFLFYILICSFACTNQLLSQERIEANGIVLDIENKPIELAQILNGSTKLFIIISPDCPISQNYSSTYNKLYQYCEERGIGMYGVVPGRIADRDEIATYQRDFGIAMPILRDTAFTLTQALDANITPEAAVVNSNGELIYLGAIDNWFIRLGKKRKIITEHYVLEALSAAIEGKYPEVSRSEAVGCYIFKMRD